MDSEKSQKLWPKYSKGDRGIFVRGIISEDELQARIVISSKYEDDDEFRRYVQRYLDHFEKLLSEANESDPENLLSSLPVGGRRQALSAAGPCRGASELGRIGARMLRYSPAGLLRMRSEGLRLSTDIRQISFLFLRSRL